MRSIHLVGIACLIASGACSSKKKAADTKEVPTSTAPDKASPLPEQGANTPSKAESGALPAIEVTIWPKEWPQVLRAAAEVTGLPIEMLEHEAASPFAPVGAALRMARIDLSMSKPMVGMDDTRPYTIVLTAPDIRFEAVAAAAIAKQEAPPARFPRLRMSLPASNVDALAEVFIAAAKEHEAKAVAGDIYVTAETALRVTKHEGAITIDLIGGSPIPKDEAGIAAALGPAAEGPVDEAFSMAAPSALRAIVRAQGLAEVGTSTGMLMVMGALDAIDESHWHQLLAEGTAEVLSAYLVMDTNQDLSDLALLEVPSGEGGKAQLALAINPAARKAFASLQPEKDSSTPASEVDWTKVVAAIPNTSVLPASTTSSGLADLFHECGWACWSHLPFASGTEMIRALGTDGHLDSAIGELKKQAGPLMPQLRLEGDLLVLGQGDAVDSQRWQKVSYDASAVVVSAGDRCYRAAAFDVRQALKGMIGSEPSQYGAILKAASAALQAAKTCATSDPASARRFDGLAALVDGLASQLGK